MVKEINLINKNTKEIQRIVSDLNGNVPNSLTSTGWVEYEIAEYPLISFFEQIITTIKSVKGKYKELHTLAIRDGYTLDKAKEELVNGFRTEINNLYLELDVESNTYRSFKTRNLGNTKLEAWYVDYINTRHAQIYVEKNRVSNAVSSASSYEALKNISVNYNNIAITIESIKAQFNMFKHELS